MPHVCLYVCVCVFQFVSWRQHLSICGIRAYGQYRLSSFAQELSICQRRELLIEDVFKVDRSHPCSILHGQTFIWINGREYSTFPLQWHCMVSFIMEFHMKTLTLNSIFLFVYVPVLLCPNIFAYPRPSFPPFFDKILHTNFLKTIVSVL